MSDERIRNIAKRLSQIIDPRELNEIAAAKMFAELFKDELKYHVESKSYCYHNGLCWTEDLENIHARTMAKEFVKAVFVYADTVTLNSVKDRIKSFFIIYDHKRNRDTLIEDAKTELADWEQRINRCDRRL